MVILVLVVAVIVLWFISTQRKLVAMDENINNAMSQIGVQLSSRWDALTALLDLTKGYAEHEYKTISDTIKMRTSISSKSSAKDIDEQENILTEAMGKIMAVAESYPELKANENYIKTMDSVKEYEELVRKSRLVYNDSVTKLNRSIRMFPTSIVAGILNVVSRDYLEANDKKADMPVMKWGMDMKLFKKATFFTALILCFCGFSVFAKNNVSEIDINVIIKNDGSARIVQNWHGSFKEGTENYIPISTEDISVSDFSVSDEKGEYTLLNEWDIDADFSKKARKCGINETDNGVELCFGISEYGENNYTISYVVEDFIKSYTDFDGTNFMLINPNMSTFPTDGSITVALENKTELNENNSGIWAFGYEGYIEFQNGAVVAQTTDNLSGDNSMIVMLRLNKGIVFPKTNIGCSFDVVKDEAFLGSDYDYADEEIGIIGIIIGFIILLIIPAIIILIIVFLLKRKKEIKEFYKETQYFRDVPNGGKIEVSHYLAQNFDVCKEESLIIGALMLSMINKGILEPQIEESVGFFGKIKEHINLKIVKKPDNIAELSLYKLLVEAGGKDGILQEKEMESYFYQYPKKINSFVDNIKENGEKEFISIGGFSNGVGNRIKDLSEKGKEELSEIMGLKKYLEEFTLIAERGIAETVIWKEYLIYATLFGISERVIKQLEKVYPEKLPEIESYNRNIVIASAYYRSMYESSQRAIQEQRVQGGGGAASLGGGGGFSGGGSR